MGKRKACFKGSWYPESRNECESFINECLKGENRVIKGDFTGSVVPHAGWYYSGSIACRTIASLAGSYDLGKGADCVVVFGLHMGRDGSVVFMESGSVETPLGDIDIHGELGQKAAAAAEKEGVRISGHSCHSFPEENTIELQLPFIKYFFKNCPILPMGVPLNQDAVKTGRAVFHGAKSLGLDIAVIGSTDLTHYGHTFGFTPAGNGRAGYEWVKNKNDASAVKALISMDCDAILENGMLKHNMCCAGAAAAAAELSRLSGAVKGIEVEYASSYDKSPGESFVGYAGVLFSL